MQFLVAAALVALVHLVTAVGAWTGVGLLADDHAMVGAAVLRHLGQLSGASMFVPDPPVPANAAVALYRPFLDLLFWLEQGWFGTSAFGYHVTNSLLHCGTALLWFVLVRRWTGSFLAGLATAQLFVGWPGHSEATHWIAARTNVLSTFLLSAALLAHDTALGRERRLARSAWLGAGALLAVVAIGTKESAVFVVPLVVLRSWLATAGTPFAGRLAGTARSATPLVAAAAAWLAWRARCLGTWGSGTGYGWKAGRVGVEACTDWLRVMVAPAHSAWVPAAVACALAALSLLLLWLGLRCWRRPEARNALALGCLLFALGWAAGIGLERLDVRTLENVRYTYEPALGLCVVCGVGLGALRPRGCATLLAVAAALHCFVLDQNRRSWLRVAANYQRMQTDIVDIARAAQQPLRVFDAPGVHDGAFGFLNGATEFRFLQYVAQHTSPPADVQGAVSSTVEWPAAIHELAAAAEQKRLPARSFMVQWHDGALAPYSLDPQWPREVWPGTTIRYARVARERPFPGTELPVHVLVGSQAPLRLQVQATAGNQTWAGAPVELAANAQPRPVALAVPLPATLAPDVPVTITLLALRGDEVRRFALGVAVPAER